MLEKTKQSIKNIANSENIVKNKKFKNDFCTHFWVNKKILLKRNGYGDVKKLVNQKCVMCGKEKTEVQTYADNRIMYGGNKN